jgi:hypothetical protein
LAKKADEDRKENDKVGPPPPNPFACSSSGKTAMFMDKHYSKYSSLLNANLHSGRNMRTKIETAPAPIATQRGGSRFIKRLDKDGDSKVSRSEFDGPPAHFDTLDKNDDGFLSEAESPQGPPPRGGRHLGRERKN